MRRFHPAAFEQGFGVVSWRFASAGRAIVAAKPLSLAAGLGRRFIAGSGMLRALALIAVSGKHEVINEH